MTVNFLDDLLTKIERKKAKVTVIGAGYVGLPLAILSSKAGFHTTLLDNNSDRVTQLKAGVSEIEAISDQQLQNSLANNLVISSEYYVIGDSDLIFICLPTPLTKTSQPDLSYIEEAMDSIKPFMRAGQMIALESTTYPGTTEELLVNKVLKMRYTVGLDYFVVYSPEREDPGNKDFTTYSIPKIISGHTKNCRSVAESIYGHLISKVVTVSSTKTAELTKLYENIYRAVNISLVNETKIIADKLGVNIHEVVEAAGTKPFGFNKFYAGPGIGGHCIPIDPFYLSYKAREIGVESKFIDVMGEINKKMPEWVCQKVAASLNKEQKSVYNSKILILGMAYKRDVGDWRESPALDIFSQLKEMGANIHYCDPIINRIKELDAALGKYRVDYTISEFSSYDAIVIVTNHSIFDFVEIQKQSNLIIDTRNVFSADYPNVVRA